MKKIWILLPACLLVASCGLLPNARTGCDKEMPYESARNEPPLRVPDGAVLPDTRGALPIPQVTAPEVPREQGRCLDYPPSYGATRPAGG